MADEVPVDGVIIKNPYSKWSEIDSSYPEYEIEVLVAPLLLVLRCVRWFGNGKRL